jgi:hypothetical protein
MTQFDPIYIPANPNRRIKPELSPKKEEERNEMKKCHIGNASGR